MRQIILNIFLGFFCFTVKAQISTEEIPYSWVRGSEEIIKQSIPVKTLPNLDMEAINQEDLEKEDFIGIPVRFGFSHDINFDLSNSGVWQTTSDGGRLWNLKIYSPDALSLNLLYDKFWIPDSAKFFIYSEDKTQHIGAFTSENNQGSRDSIMGFATSFLFTNSIILEYYEPRGTKESGIISISQAISGYRYVYDLVREENKNRDNDPDLLPCHNDVTCAVGNNYVNERNAVARIIMGGYYCTGALLNTTANDNRPVFLTADHCFSGNSNQWVFYWNYEAPCNTVIAPVFNRTTTGANVLARKADSDFMLLNLIENPAMNSNISVYYLGWDRTTSSATSGVCIHHPRGSQKKISITNKTISNHPNQITWLDDNGNIVSTTPANTHWKVDFTNGTTEVGSSGSPLLSQNKRVIGQLHGGSSGCPPNAIKYYGRFDLSWTGGGTSSTRLRDWLDPDNTNVTSLNGKTCTLTLNNRTYNSGTHTLAGCMVTISNTTIHPNTTVNIHGQQEVVINPGFHAMSGSTVHITAGQTQGRLRSSDDSNRETENVPWEKLAMIETTDVDFSIFPNPNDGNFTVKIMGDIQPYTLEVFNSSGGLLGHVNCDNETVNINRNNLDAGIYFVKITMNGKMAVRKVIVR